MVSLLSFSYHAQNVIAYNHFLLHKTYLLFLFVYSRLKVPWNLGKDCIIPDLSSINVAIYLSNKNTLLEDCVLMHGVKTKEKKEKCIPSWPLSKLSRFKKARVNNTNLSIVHIVLIITRYRLLIYRCSTMKNSN